MILKKEAVYVKNGVKVFIVGGEHGLKTAKAFSDIYRDKFEVVFEDYTYGLEKALERAKRENMTHMLYFKDDKNVVLSSFADEMGGYTLDITTDDLKNVLS